MKRIRAADLFCGAGGTSLGLYLACQELGLDLSLVAVNHWQIAIATHSANLPPARHLVSDVEDVDPRAVCPEGHLHLLWASPECVHFSNARGGKPRSEQSRASAKCVLRWLAELDVEDVLIENVREFATWGPLHRQGPRAGYPIKARKGQYFRRFIQELRDLGYRVDWRVLCAANYGDPTTRERLFIQARKRKPIVWPEPTHSKDGAVTLFGEMQKWRPAREIIDWSLPGESIFNRKRPLSPNTMRRIFAGLRKFGGVSFVLPLEGYYRGNAPRSVDEPLPTITQRGGGGIVEPYLVKLYGNGSPATSVEEPLPTITAQGGHLALVEPFLVKLYGGHDACSLDDPLPTVCANFEHFGLVEPFLVQYNGTSAPQPVDEPLPTQTTKDRFGLVVILMDGRRAILDIRFRMLQPHELAAAMSFPPDYEFAGNREERIRQIGNAVPVNLVKALCLALLRVS